MATTGVRTFLLTLNFYKVLGAVDLPSTKRCHLENTMRLLSKDSLPTSSLSRDESIIFKTLADVENLTTR